ncbi:MAG: imidazolonepropionase [Owenweeksia sp.]|nr:imidazolonepropionase [Owenweeksia sp.]
MKTVIVNISKILHIEDQGRSSKRGRDLSHFPITENAWLSIKDGKIDAWGAMDEMPREQHDEEIDAMGGMVLPTYTDSHTHLVYAGTREDEFGKRLHGATYEEIAAGGGGILNSARKLRKTSEDALYDQAAQRLDEVIKMGTGAIEIKSGYGLTTESEMKMLRVARKLGENFPLPVKTTFLGAHAIPQKFKDDRQGYLQQITEEMLPEISAQNLADYVDVFCEKGYFTVDEMIQILEAAQKYRLRSKLHLNQFNSLDSIEKAVLYDALSVDHLEVMSDKDVALLGGSKTIGTLLPGCSLFLEIPFAPARDLIEKLDRSAGHRLQPRLCTSGNMNLMISLACIKMKMTPEEALSAATLNGSAALELGHEMGSIEKGKRANLMITKPLSSPTFIPYNFGHQPIKQVLLNGKTYD